MTEQITCISNYLQHQYRSRPSLKDILHDSDYQIIDNNNIQAIFNLYYKKKTLIY